MQASHFPNHPMQTGLQRNMHPSIDGPAFQMNQMNNQQPQHVPGGNVSMPIMQASKLNSIEPYYSKLPEQLRVSNKNYIFFLERNKKNYKEMDHILQCICILVIQ